nr:putative reverse transcriptase domain-containing protein [Tanacetum cinerariifolium]
QRVADALTAYEANRNSDTGINNGTSGSVGGVEHTSRGRSSKEFLKCKLRNFNGTEGAVGLIRWFEKMKSVFCMCNCAENYHVKYVTCTLLDGALTCEI